MLDDDVEGPFVCGVFLGSILSGIIIAQFYEYIKTSGSKDSKFIQSFTTILVFLCLLNTSTNFATLYDHFITQPGPENIFYTSKLFHVNFYIAPFISGAVQLFFIYRLWVVSRSYILAILTSILALLCFLSGIIVPSLISSTYSINRTQIQDFILFTRWSSVLVDVVISVAFAITTYKSTRDTSGSTQILLPGGYILVKLLHMCLQCAVLTASLAFANAICTSMDNNSFKSQGYTAFLLSPSYVSSLLYVLNARKSLQELISKDKPLAPFNTSSFFSDNNSTITGSGGSTGGIGVGIGQMKEIHVVTSISRTSNFGDFNGVTNGTRKRPSFSDTFHQHLKSLTFRTGEEFLRRGSAISDSSGTIIHSDDNDIEEMQTTIPSQSVVNNDHHQQV